MKVKWNVDTGYVNREPARELDIADEDLEDMSETEKENYINECIDQDFRDRIHWYRVDK